MAVDTGVETGRENWCYGGLATLAYELDKPIGTSLSGDVEFYSERLAGTTGTILEPAVGTGRVLITLLEQGFTVHGYDSSTEMLDVCRANCTARGIETTLFPADMTTFRVPERSPQLGSYAAVIVSTGSLMLLADREELATALQCIHQNLVPGGLLLVDVIPPQPIPEQEPPRHWWRGDELLTVQRWHVEYDDTARRTTRWLRYELWRAGELIRTELQFVTLLDLDVAEFTKLLRQCGFTDIVGHGNYEEGRAPIVGDHIWTFEASREP